MKSDIASINTDINTLNTSLDTKASNDDITTINGKISDLNTRIYPVGSIYISVNDTNPSTLFDGTWEQIQGRFLLACDSTYTNGLTGGSSSHTHVLSDNGFAYIGNWSERLNFASGSHKWSSYTENQYSFTHNADAKLTSNDSHYSDGAYVKLGGSTDSSSSMPPYLAVYMWKRTK